MDRYTVHVALVSFLLVTLSCNCEGTVGSEADYKTLGTLCISILILFIAWLIVLILIILYYWRHVSRTRPNRNAVSHEAQLDAPEMTEWDSVQGAFTVQSHVVPTLTRCNRSTQTEPLLIETLVTPERPSHHLPPINTK
ncbi:hypothetical protein OS493_022392 [Desmophyllum pertusum]|uniref:Uncharacterized protein n=1 Tax=Desmophyllum pertusum TaxID=174260 RepID=A0A9X0A0Z1_9CNID|nr:hypothetical protein OS493_022392 [Desmophyllum pertusum]